MLAGKRHQAPIAKADLALFGRSVALLTDGGKFVTLHQKPPVTLRIGRLETEHRHGRTVGLALRAISKASRPAPMACRRISPEYHRHRGRSPCAPTGRRGRFRGRSRCSKICALGAYCACVRRDCLVVGPDHDRQIVGSRPTRAAFITWASNERPPSACNTFGVCDRMRVPSPAASTIARHVRRGIAVGLGLLLRFDASHSPAGPRQKTALDS